MANPPLQPATAAASSHFASPPPQAAAAAFASPPKEVQAGQSEQPTSPLADTAAAQASPAEMFGSPPKVDAGAAPNTFSSPPAAPIPGQVPLANREISGVSSLSSASDLITSPPANATTPTTNPVSPAQAFAQPPGGSPPKAATPAPADRSAAPQQDLVEIVEEEDFDKMDDVPLSPPAPRMNVTQPSTQAQPAPAIGDNSLPPPPFSRT